ncbi:unnamed protein product [Porites evermanni]|uniref:Uncharacterized protein n=1 Tax=Porites evermanni TaxID=104178 RepID=A0ABN8SGE5_9CNID|nr:unnamed protein product [Porites evermanni]
MFLRSERWRKSRRMIPNVSCFVQSVFSLMTSSPFEVVQCEAAALLVELTSSPQVLEEVEKCYTRIISRKSIDETLKTTIVERLKNVREKRKSLPLKKSSKVNKKVQL